MFSMLMLDYLPGELRYALYSHVFIRICCRKRRYAVLLLIDIHFVAVVWRCFFSAGELLSIPREVDCSSAVEVAFSKFQFCGITIAIAAGSRLTAHLSLGTRTYIARVSLGAGPKRP